MKGKADRIQQLHELLAVTNEPYYEMIYACGLQTFCKVSLVCVKICDFHVDIWIITVVFDT